MKEELIRRLEDAPIIAAVRDRLFDKALASPVEVIFLLGGDIATIADRIKAAKTAGKYIFIHIDLCDGIGKDRSGVRFLASCGADGIISTKSSIIKFAKEAGLISIQRFFAYDSHGVGSISEVLANTKPDIMEIMPGIIGKVIQRFVATGIPLIAGGLVETRQEVNTALTLGAFAVSTGREELWYE